MEFNATFLVSAISFIVFVFIMNMIFYKPLGAIVEKRQKFLDDNYDAANSNNLKSEALLKDKDEKLSKAGAEAKSIIITETNKAKTTKEEMTLEAKNASLKSLDEAKIELNTSKEEVKSALRSNVVMLAQDISSKILGENVVISDVDNELIDNIMQEG